MYNLLLLPAALLLFIWSTAANYLSYIYEISLKNTFYPVYVTSRIHSITFCDITIQIVTHRVDRFSCLAFVLLRIRQHGLQTLHFKLHADGGKFHSRLPQVVHRCFKPINKDSCTPEICISAEYRPGGSYRWKTTIMSYVRFGVHDHVALQSPWKPLLQRQTECWEENSKRRNRQILLIPYRHVSPPVLELLKIQIDVTSVSTLSRNSYLAHHCITFAKHHALNGWYNANIKSVQFCWF